MCIKKLNPGIDVRDLIKSVPFYGTFQSGCLGGVPGERFMFLHARVFRERFIASAFMAHGIGMPGYT